MLCDLCFCCAITFTTCDVSSQFYGCWAERTPQEHSSLLQWCLTSMESIIILYEADREQRDMSRVCELSSTSLFTPWTCIYIHGSHSPWALKVTRPRIAKRRNVGKEFFPLFDVGLNVHRLSVALRSTETVGLLGMGAQLRDEFCALRS